MALSQSLGRDRISREGVLDVRENRERRDKIVPKCSPEKQKKRKFGLKFSIFLLDRLFFARVEIGVTEFPIKTAKNKKKKIVSDIFSKVGPHPLKFHFLAAEKLTLGGITSKLAS